MKLVLAVSVLSLSTGLVAGQNDSGSCKTIAEIACDPEQADTFGILCSLVQSSAVADALSSKDETFTVWAPTNEAFENAPPIGLGEVDTLLLFHAVQGQTILSSDLVCKETIEMASGRNSRTVCDNNRAPTQFFQRGADNIDSALPEIISADIMACNGVIHVINNVMLPNTLLPDVPPNSGNPAPPDSGSCKTIAEIACDPDQADTFGILCSLVQSSAVADALSSKDETFTVWAPTNEAFENAPPIGLGEVDTLLLFHAVQGRTVLSSDLVCKETIKMASGKSSRTVCDNNQAPTQFFQRGADNINSALPEIISVDIMACNGVVHVINNVMLPSAFLPDVTPNSGK